MCYLIVVAPSCKSFLVKTRAQPQIQSSAGLFAPFEMLASLMSDDTWLWPSVPGTPALSAGDWPVMDTDPSTLRRVRRRSFSIIDNRNRKGYITRRYQCFPLAPLPEDRKYDSLPDLVLHPEQETIKCKEKHYSQPL